MPGAREEQSRSFRTSGGARIAQEALVPFVSQLAYSATSFFAVSGLARQFGPRETAAVLAAYSLESMAISWGTSRWVGLFLLRETRPLALGDAEVISRGFAALVLIAVGPLFGAALLVAHSATAAAYAAAWACAMLFSDLWRFALSRFGSLPTVTTISGLFATLSITFSFRSTTFESYLGMLLLAALLHGLACKYALRRKQPVGVSAVWTADRSFGRSWALESLVTSAASGVGTVLISTFNPVLAVALQLGNQILTMPAAMLSQAVGLPLTRRMVLGLQAKTYPLRIISWWTAISGGIAVLGFVLLYPARPVVSAFLGVSADYVYLFLPVVLVQALISVAWQPTIAARRWTHGPVPTSKFVAGIFAFLYVGVTVLAIVRLPLAQLALALLGFVGVIMAVVVVQSIAWVNQGERWAREGACHPPAEIQ